MRFGGNLRQRWHIRGSFWIVNEVWCFASMCSLGSQAWHFPYICSTSLVPVSIPIHSIHGCTLPFSLLSCGVILESVGNSLRASELVRNFSWSVKHSLERSRLPQLNFQFLWSGSKTVYVKVRCDSLCLPTSSFVQAIICLVPGLEDIV